MNLKPFELPKEFTLEELLRRLSILYDKEFLPIVGQSRSADVGESLEYYLGLDKNTSKKSDWGDYEIKTVSGKKITLFSFSWNFSDEISPIKLTREYGKKHFSKHLKKPVIRLDWPIKHSKEALNELHYIIDEVKGIINLRYNDRNLGYFSLQELSKRFHDKLKNLVIIGVKKIKKGENRLFRIKKISVYESSSFTMFVLKLKENQINIEPALMLKNLNSEKPKLNNRGNLVRGKLPEVIELYEKESIIVSDKL